MVIAGQAFAQGEAATEQEPRTPIIYNPEAGLVIYDYEDIPEEAIEEAEIFLRQCESDYHRSMHYDCECQAMRFLEQKIIRGPDTNPRTVLLDLYGVCPNKPGAAAYAFDKCMNQSPSFYPDDQDPESFCECAGNSYARLYARSGEHPSSSQMVRMRTMAAISCRERGESRQIIGPIQ